MSLPDGQRGRQAGLRTTTLAVDGTGMAAYADMRRREPALVRRTLAVLAGSALGLTGSTAALASRPAAAAPPTTCTRHAYAAAVSSAGKLIWRTSLPATSQEFQTSFTPAIGATEGYWPEDGIVHALRNRDGKQLWQYVQGLSLNGTWLNHGVVSVLSDDFGGGGLLTGLDATTGKVLWRDKIPGKGLTIGGPVTTADGGLAWVRADGVLQVIDLTTGKARFAVREGTAAQIAAQFPQLVALGSQVFYLANGRLVAYDDLHGKLAWTNTAVPVHGSISAAADDLVIDGGWTTAPYGLGAINPVDGSQLWLYDVKADITVLTGGSGLIAVAPDVGNAVPHEWMLDEHTGAVVWQTDTEIFNTPVVIRAHDTIAVEGDGDYDKPAQLVDRSLVDGHVLWQVTLHHQPATAQQLTIDGTLMVISPDPEFAHPNNPLFGYGTSNGHAAWTLSSLRPLQAAPVLLGKSLLVSSADDPDLC